MKVPRNYHSVAVLLKDGRVMAAGGGLCGGCSANHLDSEILTPPYLLNGDGSPATIRPGITASPDNIIPGGTIDVSLNSAAQHSFALVRNSVTTHTVNNDQRRIPLQVTKGINGVFTLQIPQNPNVLLPGTYFLFALNGNGVPSVAHVVQRPIHYSIPTPSPTSLPTPPPTRNPTPFPTKAPTKSPTKTITKSPTKAPTKAPTSLPTAPPTPFPTQLKTAPPTALPTPSPTPRPTPVSTHTQTSAPTLLPTEF